MVYKNISNIPPKQSGKTRHSRYINTLSQIAINVEPVAQARIAAGIVYRNNLISIGVNRSKTHPFQKRYCKNKDAIYLHAETDAIKNSINKIDLEKFSNSILYICRVKIYKKKFVFWKNTKYSIESENYEDIPWEKEDDEYEFIYGKEYLIYAGVWKEYGTD